MRHIDEMFLWAFMSLKDEMMIILWYDYSWDEHLWHKHEHGWYEGDDVIYVICMADDMKEVMLFMYMYGWLKEMMLLMYMHGWDEGDDVNYVYAWMIWRKWCCINMHGIWLYDDDICSIWVSLY